MDDLLLNDPERLGTSNNRGRGEALAEWQSIPGSGSKVLSSLFIHS